MAPDFELDRVAKICFPNNPCWNLYECIVPESAYADMSKCGV
jgi:hypothetical protein